MALVYLPWILVWRDNNLYALSYISHSGWHTSHTILVWNHQWACSLIQLMCSSCIHQVFHILMTHSTSLYRYLCYSETNHQDDKRGTNVSIQEAKFSQSNPSADLYSTLNFGSPLSLFCTLSYFQLWQSFSAYISPHLLSWIHRSPFCWKMEVT